MYALDTNAIIYYLKGDSVATLVLSSIFKKDTPIYISAISEVELFGFSDLSTKEMYDIDNILRTIAIIPVDSNIARAAGALRRIYRLKTPDSAIAATALFTGSILLTRNVNDFKKIPHLSLQKI